MKLLQNIQERREIISRRDNDQTKLTISPQQQPVLIDSVDHLANSPQFTEIERARGMLQSTPKESIRPKEREIINTPSEKEIRLPVHSKSEEFYVKREEPAKIGGSRSFTEETTMCYLNTPMQQQQSLQIQQLLDQQRQHINALTLPHTEVPVFTGDPIEYCGFIRAFENLIETKTTSPSARLYYLIQFTKGDVQELMRSCLPMEANEGYDKAKGLLKSKHGQSYKISAAYAERILKVPQIKSEDGRSLQRFSVLLTSCQNTLKEIGCINKLENPDTLQKVVEKLPYGLRQRWRDVADHITEEQNREITIQDITNFIDKKARAANHPLFGNLSNNAQETRNRITTTVENKRKPTFSTARASYATHGELPSIKPYGEKKVIKCALCSEQHWLSRCKVFKEKSLQERIKFTREKGLCDNCLVAGHMARSCPKDSFCKVEDCKIGRKHSTFLHPKNDSQDKVQNSGEPATTKPKEAQPNCISSFLDPGSNTTFCTEKLINHLGLSGNEKTLSLTTMNAESVESDCIVVSLQVSDLDQNTVELMDVYSCKKRPVTEKDIPQQEDANRWSHLDGLNLPRFKYTDIDLLIGSDVPQALEPKQVKESQNGGPFAVKTLLGWTVNGPLGRKGKQNSSTNRIHADVQLDEQFRRYCDMEFNAMKLRDEWTMSQEDIKALSQIKESARMVEGHYEIALPWQKYPPDLPNNKNAALQRLELLKKRLTRDDGLHQKYTTFMEERIRPESS